METINDLYHNILRRQGHWKVELMIPVFAIRDWWIGKVRAKRSKYVWEYECGCPAPRGAFSAPYCPYHGMELYRKLKEDKR